jgi:hypothetical protein
MRKPANLQHHAPPRPGPCCIVPAVIPPEDRSRGGPAAVNPVAPTAVRASSADLVPARRPTARPRRRPVTDGGSKPAAKAPAGSPPASWEFLEYEQGGGI